MRKESDFLGEVKLPDDALYGINAYRAQHNFPDTTPFHKEWYKAIGLVKEACYNTVIKFRKRASKKIDIDKLPVAIPAEDILKVMATQAHMVASGEYFNHFIVPAIQGGAGTSINLNINEIIANASLHAIDKKHGDYDVIDPFEHANIYQSTNDVIPTALKIAVLELLQTLEDSINDLRKTIEKIESENRHAMRIGYTQLQEAVPSSFGILFSTYNEALSRDWWRVSKCFERIKTVNMGGGATGTAMSIPRFFVMEVVSELQCLTKLPITRSENLSDTTNNLDSFVEIHAILKSHAVNIEKMVNDIRLLAADVVTDKALDIPQVQTGSSIMPGKVNPVIPEFAISSAHKIYSNDMLISSLCAQGNFELNAYIPTIGHAVIESIKLLIAVNRSLKDRLFNGLVIRKEASEKKLYSSASVTTALIPYIGYKKASEIAFTMRENSCDVFEANRMKKAIEEDKIKEILSSQNLLKLGFSIFEV
jgi:aspartate ammonia-lyase